MSRESVLVVEDETIVALDLRQQLEAGGYEVVGVVEDVPSALRAVRDLRPRLVLMDVRLRGEPDGITAAEEIYVCHDTPVVVLTAYSDEETLERAAETGAYGYLLKPVAPSALSLALRMALRKHEELQVLRAKGEWLERALDRLGAAVVVTDETAAVCFMNTAARDLCLATPALGAMLVASAGTAPSDDGEAQSGRTLSLRLHDGGALRVRARRLHVTGAREGCCEVWLLSPLAA